LSVETLEPRTVLAGSVTASVTGGVLTITGDAQGNSIVISSGDTAGQVIIGGAFTQGSATRVNGNLAPVPFDDVTDIVLDLRGGADKVLVTDLDLAGDLTGNLGAGDDLIRISNNDSAAIGFILNIGEEPTIGEVSIGGDVSLQGNDGDDTLRIEGASITGNLEFTGGAGGDTVAIRNTTAFIAEINTGPGDDLVSILESEVVDHLNIDAGPGKDWVRLNDVEAPLFELLGGPGNDQFAADLNDLTSVSGVIRTGQGNDNVLLRNAVIQRGLTLDLGSGNDQAIIRDVEVDGLFQLFGGNGNDYVRLESLTVGRLDLFMRNGNDRVDIIDSVFNRLNVSLGNGQDQLCLKDVTVVFSFQLIPSQGADIIKDKGGNMIPGL
jgi:hypothetical protein